MMSSSLLQKFAFNRRLFPRIKIRNLCNQNSKCFIQNSKRFIQNSKRFIQNSTLSPILEQKPLNHRQQQRCLLSVKARSSSFTNTASKPSYFDVLYDGRRDFNISQRELKQRFLTLQQKFHPDNHGLKSEEERQESLAMSMLVNKAYQTLRDPLSRATYLLSLEGHEIEENDRTSLDPNFLVEILETQEAIEECHNHETCTQINHRNSKKLSTCLAELDEAFRCKNYPLAKAKVIELKYYKNIEVACQSTLLQLEFGKL